MPRYRRREHEDQPEHRDRAAASCSPSGLRAAAERSREQRMGAWRVREPTAVRLTAERGREWHAAVGHHRHLRRAVRTGAVERVLERHERKPQTDDERGETAE